MRTIIGKTAVVTGASRGIGVYIARALAAEGANLVLAARSSAELEGLAAELRGQEARVIAAPVDVVQLDGQTALLTAAEAAFGAVDILVNNAGLDFYGAYHELALEDIEPLIRLNVLAPMQLTRRLLPGMLARRWGHIVNLSSLAGKFTPAYHEAYNTSKAALIHFTLSLRASYRGTGVSASAVTPGFVHSAGMFQTIMDETGIRPAPMVGASSPEAVAQAVVRAVREDLPEVVVSPRPIWPLVVLKTFFPRFTERIQSRLGNDVFRQAAERPKG
ncbi:MAG: SDR family NAD(P)-dependent oxidoreductase [Anaerolineae bacterium]|nr:SDR family NAD(P)-dependent oxidoreductase [Anaerolineae bacterium]